MPLPPISITSPPLRLDIDNLVLTLTGTLLARLPGQLGLTFRTQLDLDQSFFPFSSFFIYERQFERPEERHLFPAPLVRPRSISSIVAPLADRWSEIVESYSR